MRNFILVVILFIVCSCASQPVSLIKLHDLGSDSNGKVATINSICSQACKDKLTEVHGFEMHSIPLFGVTAQDPILQSINGEIGSFSYPSNCDNPSPQNVYNSNTAFEFELELLAGEKLFELYYHGCSNYSNTNTTISVTLEPGKVYSLIVVVNKGASEWFPALYNNTDNELIYGNPPIQWINP